MNRLFLTILFGVGLPGLLTSCKDQDETPILSFEYRMDTTVTIPEADSGDYRDTAFMTKESVMGASSLESRNLSTIDIQDVNLDSAKLLYQKPEGFNWLDSLTISFNAGPLDRELVADKKRVPMDSLQVLKLSTKGTNLAPYIQQKDFYLLISTKHRQQTEEPLKTFLQLFFTFRYEDD